MIPLLRRLLVLLLLVVSPLAMAQEARPTSAHGAGEPPVGTGPVPRPALVEGELTTPRFRILYTAGSKGSAQVVADKLEAIRASFVTVLGRDWQGITEVRLGRDRDEYEALALPRSAPPKWAVALAYPEHNIILLNARSLFDPEGDMTLRHELVHVALGQLAKGWPTWFQEGLAQHLAGERIVVTHYAALFRALQQKNVLHFDDLTDHWPENSPAGLVEVAYAQSADFVAFLAARHGPEMMNALIDGMTRGEPFQMAFGKAFHTPLQVEEDAWRKELASRFSWLPLDTTAQIVWALAPVLCVAAFVARRRQKAARLEEMSVEEAAEDAAEEAALRVLAAEAARQGLPPLQPEELIPEWAEQPPPPPEDSRDFLENDGEHGPHSPPSKPTLH